ncbi:MAG TPA: ABC transporter transmembrane domain-containing protein [Candidatus Competibacteraceae bacterium]|nr:ABC transporter transmembrane domain-containing protein [Candidatus Competibacteraceae bacterium]
MDQQRISIDKVTGAYFVRAVRNFATSDVGWKAKWMFAGLIALLFVISGMNVMNSYVGRHFMTAIEQRNQAEFIWQALLYLGVFAASTIVAVVSRFLEENLGLLWREFITRRAITTYLAQDAYYRLDSTGKLTNPDQRIADDVRAFTVTTLSFVLMFLNGSFTVVAFSGVLWSISPLLFIVAVLYAACGTYLTIILGRPLIKLNYDQLDKEANFRSTLIQVRENAEELKLAHREDRFTARLQQRFEELVSNFRRIIVINRNLGFFTTGYNWLIQIIPALIVAPYFIAKEVEFGVITQSAMAFSMLLGAFSLIVTQFQSISSFTAVVARLHSLVETVEQAPSPPGSAIQMSEEDGRVAYEDLTLLSPQEGRPLLKDLSLSIPAGTRVLIAGPNEAAKGALFKATAGIWTSGEGRIIRPGADNMLWLAERPYLPPGTLREILLNTGQEPTITDDRILSMLRELKLESVPARAGGLDREQDWEPLLSLSEQQLLACLHVLLAAPQFAFLDRPDTTLSREQVNQILQLFLDDKIGYLTIGEPDESLDFYDAMLEIADDGSWKWRVIKAGNIIAE